MTISNLAVLHQRLGADERALDLYAQLQTGETMQPSEEAQLLVNQGWLLRRLGDPIKAMQTYRQAQALFARAQHRDGEIGAWRNIGIAYALDLNDQPAGAGRVRRGAEAGAGVVEPARRSPGPPVPRRDASPHGAAGRSGRASSRPRSAAPRASASSKSSGRRSTASAGWPRPRAAARRPGGRTSRPSPPSNRFAPTSRPSPSGRSSWPTSATSTTRSSRCACRTRRPRRRRCSRSSSRAARAPGRTVCSRARSGCRSRDVQPKIAPGALLLEYWSASGRLGAGLGLLLRVRHRQAGGEPRTTSQTVQRFADAVSRGGDDWRTASVAAGRILLSGLPDLAGVTRLLVVPDGPLHFVPFEALTVPGARRSARRAVRDQLSAVGRVARPPQRAAGPPVDVAMAAHAAGLRRSAAGAGRPRRRGAALPRLSYADEEIRGIAESLPGRAELHLGADAQKRFLHQELRRARRCCTSARTRSPTRAIPTGRASCSRRRRPAGRPTTCSCARSTTSTSPACSWSRCRPATPSAAR